MVAPALEVTVVVGVRIAHGRDKLVLHTDVECLVGVAYGVEPLGRALEDVEGEPQRGERML